MNELIYIYIYIYSTTTPHLSSSLQVLPTIQAPSLWRKPCNARKKIASLAMNGPDGVNIPNADTFHFLLQSRQASFLCHRRQVDTNVRTDIILFPLSFASFCRYRLVHHHEVDTEIFTAMFNLERCRTRIRKRTRYRL
jgi:hypothetical protein